MFVILKKPRASVEYYIDGRKNPKFPQLNNKIIPRNLAKKILKSSLLASSFSKLMPKDLEHYNWKFSGGRDRKLLYYSCMPGIIWYINSNNTLWNTKIIFIGNIASSKCFFFLQNIYLKISKRLFYLELFHVTIRWIWQNLKMPPVQGKIIRIFWILWAFSKQRREVYK